MEKEKVLHVLITSFLDVWSMGNERGAPSFFNTIYGFADAGHKVSLVLPKRSGDTIELNHAEKTEFIHKNVKIFRISIPLLHYGKKGIIGMIFRKLSGFQFAFRAAKFCVANSEMKQIDVIYGHEDFGIAAGYLFNRSYKRAKFVSRMKGIALFCMWKRLVTFKDALSLLSDTFRLIAIRLPCNLFIMTNDGSNGDQFLQRLGVSNLKIKFLKNGIYKSRVPIKIKSSYCRNLNIPENSFLMLSACRLDSGKGVDLTIKSLPGIVEAHANCIFLIIGDGVERNNLEQLARHCNIEEHVVFLGAQTHQETLEWISICDLFVSTNHYSNLSNQVFEAMWSMKCVITIDFCATSSVIQHLETGYLIDRSDDKLLTRGIVKLIDDSNLRLKLAEAAHHFVNDNFDTWEQRIEKEVKIVEKLSRILFVFH